jgi:hypothetical protein
MKNFKHFIEECEDLNESLITEATGSAANSQGVAFEAALTRELHHKGKFAESHPNEDGMSAEEAHRHHMNNLSQEMQLKVASGAKAAAKALRDHLHDHGHYDQKEKLETTWTSKPGQLSRTVGVDDPDNPSDIVLSTRDRSKHVGVSLKFGEKPGLRSPGVKDLSSMAGIKHFQPDIDSHKEELVKDMGKHVSGVNQNERNDQYRAAEKGSPAAKTAAAKVKSKSLMFRSSMAARYAAGFSKLSHEKATDAVRRLMNAEKTNTNYIKLSHNPKNGKTDISDPVADFDKMHGKVKKYHFSSKGMYTDVHAEDKDGNLHHVLRIGIKDKSSPMTNIVGSVAHAGGYKRLLNA